MWSKFKYKVQRFMIGRYGVDTLGMHILWFCVALSVLSLFFRKQSPFLYILMDVLTFYELYRALSKNHGKRNRENTLYLDCLTRVKRSYKVFKNNLTDKQYHYYLCPKCAQMIRIPKGRGKITIHCPNCRHSFDRKSKHQASSDDFFLYLYQRGIFTFIFS